MPTYFFNTKTKPLTMLKGFCEPINATFYPEGNWLKIIFKHAEVDMMYESIVDELYALDIPGKEYGINLIRLDNNVISLQFELQFEDYLNSDAFKSLCRDMGSKEGVWLIKEIFDYYTPTAPLDYTDDDPGLVIRCKK